MQLCLPSIQAISPTRAPWFYEADVVIIGRHLCLNSWILYLKMNFQDEYSQLPIGEAEGGFVVGHSLANHFPAVLRKIFLDGDERLSCISILHHMDDVDSIPKMNIDTCSIELDLLGVILSLLCTTLISWKIRIGQRYGRWVYIVRCGVSITSSTANGWISNISDSLWRNVVLNPGIVRFGDRRLVSRDRDTSWMVRTIAVDPSNVGLAGGHDQHHGDRSQMKVIGWLTVGDLIELIHLLALSLGSIRTLSRSHPTRIPHFFLELVWAMEPWAWSIEALEMSNIDWIEGILTDVRQVAPLRRRRSQNIPWTELPRVDDDGRSPR